MNEARSSFEVTELESMYANLLHHNIIPYIRHVSRFADKLISAVPELEQRSVKVKKKFTLYFSHDIDHNLLGDLQEPDFFIKSLSKVINATQKVTMDTNNSFNGSFPEDCQKKSIPAQLLSMVTMIIDGTGINKEISQHACYSCSYSCTTKVTGKSPLYVTTIGREKHLLCYVTH